MQPGDETLPWRKGRVTHRPRPTLITPWRKRPHELTVDEIHLQHEEIEKIKPWTEEEVSLKKAPHVEKIIPKEHLEEVELRPAKIEKHEIVPEELEKVELRHVEKQALDAIKLGQPHLEEVYGDRMKPWTAEEIHLKRAPLVEKIIPKEHLEEVELRPAKIEKHVYAREELQKVDLKHFAKETIEAIQRSDEVFLKEILTEKVKPWTEEEVILKKTPHVEKIIPKEHLEEVELKPAKIEKHEIYREELEKVDLKHFAKETIEAIQKHDGIYLKEVLTERVKPWTEEEVILKKTPHVEKIIPKEHLEEVELKPAKIEKHNILKEELEKVDLRHHEKETTQKQVKQRDLFEKYLEEEDSNFMKRRTDINIRYDKKSKEKPEEDDKIKPWTQEQIKLKPSKIEKKIFTKQVIEDVHLKPSRQLKRTFDEIEEEEEEEVSQFVETEDTSLLNRRKKAEEQIRRLTERSPYSEVEDSTFIKDNKKIEEEKTWRRQKKMPEKSPYSEVEDSTFIRDDKKIEEEKTWRRQKKVPEKSPYVETEDTKLIKDEKIEETAVSWRKQGKKPKNVQPYQELEDKTIFEVKKESEEEILSPQKVYEEKTEEEQLEETTLPWLRKKKVPKFKEELVLKPTKKAPKKEKSTAEIILKPLEEIIVEKTEETAVSWRKLQKKPYQEVEDKTILEVKKNLEEEKTLIPKKLIEDKPKEEKVEETAVPWLRGKKTPKVKDEIKIELKPTKVIKLPEEPTFKEEIKLKPTKRIPKEEKATTDIVLKPIEKLRTKEKIIKEVESIEKIEESTVSWRKSKKKPQEIESYEEVEDITLLDVKKDLDEKSSIPKKVDKPKEETLQESGLPWLRKKKEPKVQKVEKEEIKIELQPQEKKTTTEIVLKPLEKIDTLEKVEEKEIEGSSISWRKSKKKSKDVKPYQEVEDQTVLQIKTVEEENPKEEMLQETAVPWLRGRRVQKVEKDEIKIELVPNKEIPLPEQPSFKEEIALKPIKKIPKEEKMTKEIVLQPIEKIVEKVESIEKIEEEKMEETTVSWRKSKKKSKEVKPYQEVEDKTFLEIQKVVEEKPKEEMPQETAVPWLREKKVQKIEKDEIEIELLPTKEIPIPEQPLFKEEKYLKPAKKIPEDTKSITEIILKPLEEKIIQKVESVEKIEEEVEETSVSWRRSKKKPKEDKSLVPEKVTEIKPKEEAPQETAVPWVRGKKSPKVQKVEKDEVKIELKPTKEIALPEQPMFKEEIALKPKDEKSTTEFVVKPVTEKVVQEVKLVEEKVQEETAVSWRKIRKTPKKMQPYEEIEDKTIIEEEKTEETALPWVRKKKLPKPKPVLKENVYSITEEHFDSVEEIETAKDIRTEIDISISEEHTIAPHFVQKLQPTVSGPRETTKLVCTVKAKPAADITWYKNGREIYADEKYTMYNVENVSTLEIANVTEEDVALYTCKAINKVGQASCTANLIVFGT